VSSALGLIRNSITVKSDQERLGHRARGVRQPDEHGQDYSLVAIAVDGVAVESSNGITIFGFAVNVLAMLAGNRMTAGTGRCPTTKIAAAKMKISRRAVRGRRNA